MLLKAHAYFSDPNSGTVDATVSIGPSLCSVTDGPHFLSNKGRPYYSLFL